jgi:hypothetical protein
MFTLPWTGNLSNHGHRMEDGVVAWTSSHKILPAMVKTQKDNMKKALMMAAASGCLLVALPVQGGVNLVTNPGFEDPTLAPSWGSFNAVLTSDAHSGAQAAELDASLGVISQTVGISSGNKYAVDFWAKAPGSGALTVTLDSIAVDTIVTLTGTYAHFHYEPVIPTSPGSISFVWSDGAVNKAFIDDVDVHLVPEPSTYFAGVGALALLALFGWSTHSRGTGVIRIKHAATDDLVA